MLRARLKKNETQILRGSKLVVTDQRVITPSVRYDIKTIEGPPIIREALIRSQINDAIGFVGLLAMIAAFSWGFGAEDAMDLLLSLIYLIIMTGAFHSAANDRFRVKGYAVDVTLDTDPAAAFSQTSVTIFSDTDLSLAKLAAGAILTAQDPPSKVFDG